MEVLFPEYFQGIYGIFPYHEKHFHTMELDKTMEIRFPTFFYNISNFFPYYGKTFPMKGTNALKQGLINAEERCH